jgi:hypothetical protein
VTVACDCDEDEEDEEVAVTLKGTILELEVGSDSTEMS